MTRRKRGDGRTQFDSRTPVVPSTGRAVARPVKRYFEGMSEAALFEPPAITISTRRLLARPSAVSLLATGFALPLPTDVILSEGTPLLTR